MITLSNITRLDAAGYSQTAGETCGIGMTNECFIHCLGGAHAIMTGKVTHFSHFAQPDPAKAHRRNYQEFQENPARWTSDMVAMVRYEGTIRNGKYFRANVVGDFLDARQVQAWAEIAKEVPFVHFWGYTRTWRGPGFIKVLQPLADLPNYSLWGSTDVDSWAEWLEAGMPLGRTACMLTQKWHDVIVRALAFYGVPWRNIMVFIDGRLRNYYRRKYPKGYIDCIGPDGSEVRVPICPKERKLKTRFPVTCRSCRACIDLAPTPISNQQPARMAV